MRPDIRELRKRQLISVELQKSEPWARFFIAMRLFTLFVLIGFLTLMPWTQPFWLASPWVAQEHDGQRLVQMALFFCVALASLETTWGSARATHKWPITQGAGPIKIAAPAIAFFVLSSVEAQRPPWAFLEVVLFGGIVMLAWLLATAQPRQREWVWTAALTGVGLFSITTVFATVLGMAQGLPPLVVKAIPGYSNVRHWNHVQVAAIPLMIGAIWYWRKLRPITWIGTASVVSCVALLWTTGGRAASIALVGSAMLLALLLGRKAVPLLLRWTYYVFWGVLLGMALLQWLPQMLGIPAEQLLLARPITTSSESARLELWALALAMAFEHPWLGVGPMHFANHPNPIAAHPHNIYVQLAAEWGFPTAFVLIGAAVFVMWQMVRRLRQLPADHEALYIGMVLWWGCAAVMIDGLFSGNFVMPMSQVWIATLLGLTWAWWRSTSPPSGASAAEASVLPRAALVLWCVISAAALIWTAIMFLERQTHLHGAPETWQGQVLEFAPRYWTMGWFE
jgi:O-antigen ligase